MSTVNGFQVGSETLKYNYESLDNYNTPNFSTSSSKTYTVGDYVMYNGKLYKCTTATTGGTWVSSSWALAVLSDDVSDLNRQISDVEENQIPELKSALTKSTGNGEIPIETSGYLRCANSPVDFTDVGTSSDYKYTVLNVNAGDQFTITGGSIGVAARLYCFTDENGVILDNADANATVNELLLTAPSGAKKLILNKALLASPVATAIYNQYLVDKVLNLSADLTQIKSATVVPTSDKTVVSFNNNDGYFLNSDGTVSAYQTGWLVTDEIDISSYERLIVSASSGYNHLLYAFYKSDHVFISGDNSGSGVKTLNKQTVIIPENAKYIRISSISTEQAAGLIGESNIKYENNAFSTKWEGKKWVCIGDSLTETNNTAALKYYNYISDETGITALDYGKSGTGYANPGNTNNFLTRIASIPTDADVYTIFGSFNDYEYSVNNNIPIGDPTDTGTSTLCGYINSTLSALTTRITLANVGIVAPCPWVSVNEYNGAGNGFGKDYCDALKAICERWSIPFLNLYEDSGLRPWDASFVAAAYTHDTLMGVHPDETGHKILSTKFKAFLGTLLS